MRALILAAALALALPGGAHAVLPDEILEDSELEARARALSADLRCVVCRNESIDESNADLARDMRLLVRERLVEGDSDAEVMAYLVDRYGEFVLLRPTTSGANLVLWISAPVMLILALGVAVVYLRRRDRTAEPGAPGLSPEEEARLRELTRD
ncbi:cytochrome c-type biogenesis protein [Rhodobaculum claviforme]|uniref:Cytochrome c-type biogenesis protein n=1 Tax=Rhodobaculum claviforme TaxID=1549854 RepID=A0A934WE03_9RHOB|nr:cytochrome c-type biogenesis protein [Rhodobaculum claviforme]MBK5925875.1 cytochrome C biogenesis protein CcdA [Rhodobaculum claviforme]